MWSANLPLGYRLVTSCRTTTALSGVAGAAGARGARAGSAAGSGRRSRGRSVTGAVERGPDFRPRLPLGEPGGATTPPTGTVGEATPPRRNTRWRGRQTSVRGAPARSERSGRRGLGPRPAQHPGEPVDAQAGGQQRAHARTRCPAARSAAALGRASRGTRADQRRAERGVEGRERSQAPVPLRSRSRRAAPSSRTSQPDPAVAAQHVVVRGVRRRRAARRSNSSTAAEPRGRFGPVESMANGAAVPVGQRRQRPAGARPTGARSAPAGSCPCRAYRPFEIGCAASVQMPRCGCPSRAGRRARDRRPARVESAGLRPVQQRLADPVACTPGNEQHRQEPQASRSEALANPTTPLAVPARQPSGRASATQNRSGSVVSR